MKIVYTLFFFLSCLVIHAQSPNDTSLSTKQLKYERLLERGKKQFKTGSVLLATGYTAATLGFLTALEYGYIMDDWLAASTVLFVTGTAAVASGWYFFISAAIKKKKAKTELKWMTQKVWIDQRNYISQPSIGIAFRF
jgi:hypothetical protein